MSTRHWREVEYPALLERERDQARDIAVALEQENAELLAELSRQRQLIEDFRVRVERRKGGDHRKDRRWWGAFEHGLDCALADLEAARTKMGVQRLATAAAEYLRRTS